MDLIGSLKEIIRQSVLDPLGSDAIFRTGYLWGLMTSLVVGLVGQQIYFLWNRVAKFFRPTKTPGSTPGPSPVSSTMSCLSSLVGLVLIAILLAIVIYLLGRS